MIDTDIDLYRRNLNRLVSFNEWCGICVHHGKNEHEEPCDECLRYPAVDNLNKPLKFKKKEEGDI